MALQVSRNDPCPCGSGEKYKRCCLGNPKAAARRMRVPLILAGIGVLLGVAMGWEQGMRTGLTVAAAGLLIAGIVASFWHPPPPGQGKGDSAGINFGS